MALFELDGTQLSSIERVTFSSAGIREREHLQTALIENVSAILDGVMVLGDEQNLWQDANRRIDLLCIDRKANLVVVELKRGDTGATAELQAIRYTAMLSTMTFKDVCAFHSTYLKGKGQDVSADDAEQIIRSFLGWEDEGEEEDFNQDPRIVLVSGDFSKELTNTVLWLNSKGLDITCIRMVAYRNSDQILVDIQKVIPVPEVEDYQVKLRRREEEKADARRYKRDYTKYRWRGETYWKNKLAHAIIQDWVQENEPENATEIQLAFPVSQLPWMIESLERAKYVEEQNGRTRHYMADDEVLKLGDGSIYCVTRGWNITTITEFLDIARAKGYDIETVA
ncbi:MAG: hypothetical protein AAGK66_07155 [Pseudomonadota bacterium]